MKVTGMLLVVLCSTMTGIYMASGLSQRVERYEKSISLMGMMLDRLRYLQPTMRQLVESMAALEQFSQVDYLVICKEQMRQGRPFPESWRHGVQEGRSGGGMAQILLPLGEVLGSTDLDSQLAAIQHTKGLLENRLAEARAYRERHARLYQSLGLLTGIAIVIMLI